MFVKPGEGRAPRDPRTMLRIPPEGQAIDPLDSEWLFLLRVGDVVEAAPPDPAPEPTSQVHPEPAATQADEPKQEAAPAAAHQDEEHS